MTYPGAAALAAALYIRNLSPPSKPRRYFVLWFGQTNRVSRRLGRDGGCAIASVLKKYGVYVDGYTYRTKVGRKIYSRCKTVVRDTKILAAVIKLFSNRIELIRAMKRFENIVIEVFESIGRFSREGVSNLTREFPMRRLRRWFGVKPYRPRIYVKWEKRRYLMKRIRLKRWLRKFIAAEYSSRKLIRELGGKELGRLW